MNALDWTYAVIMGAMLCVAFFAHGYFFGRKMMAKEIRSDGELCWHCHGTGKERT